MAVRNKRKSCHNCPAPTPPVKPAVPVAVPLDIETDQGLRLWKHVLFGTTTCVGMIEGYAAGNMPGNPIDGVRHLRDRLSAILNKLEAKNHATDSAAK